MSTISNYQWIKTGDGSPSLIWDEREAMHNKAGAWSETQYVYGEALRQPEILKKLRNLPGSKDNESTESDQSVEGEKQTNKEFSVFILGLGLGYLELVSVAEYLKLNSAYSNNSVQLKILTYEIDPYLKEGFLLWLQGQDHPLKPVFDELNFFLEKDYPGLPVKERLLQAYNQSEWQLLGELSSETLVKDAFHFILYDAFSRKSTPSLWTIEFLNQFLENIASPNCAFATYACTGDLRRTLSANGFQVFKRPGYSGKRDCTLAIRLVTT